MDTNRWLSLVPCALFAACAATPIVARTPESPLAEESDSPATRRESEPTDEEGVQHELALFLGGGTERAPGEPSESGSAVALEFISKLQGPWALSLTLEHLGKNLLRENLVVTPVSYFPVDHWRILAGPGIGFLEGDSHLVFRLGTSYAFDIGGGWRFGPEVFVDFVEGGGNVYVGGLALGREF